MWVGALQLDVRRGAVERNLARVERGLREAADGGLALCVLPEMWPTSFADSGSGGGPGGGSGGAAGRDAEELLDASGAALERVRELSRELELVVAGSALGRAAPGRPPYNRLHVFAGGREVLSYDKVHLFSPTAEGASFSAGASPPTAADTPAGRLAGVVCYDLRFGPLTRQCFLAGAEILVCPAQWPTARASSWRALLCGRAVENQCFVVGANRTGTDVVGRRRLELDFPGNSLICAPDGTVLAEGWGEEGLVTADVDLGAVARVRRRVPVEKDQRGELYRRWG